MQLLHGLFHHGVRHFIFTINEVETHQIPFHVGKFHHVDSPTSNKITFLYIFYNKFIL